MGRVNKRKNAGFKSAKQREKLNNISKSLLNHWRVNFEHYILNHDHTYTSHADYHFTAGQLNLADVHHEEIVNNENENVRLDADWGKGRRIVELDVLADGLKACAECGNPLHLHHSIGITTYGIGAMLKVVCSNTKCHHTNTIPTGKRHDRIWDANSKLAAAMVHAGMCVEQVNNFLSTLNIPPVSVFMLNRRLQEAGEKIEETAKDSVTECLQQEEKLTLEKFGTKAVTASVDAGWQKRGSGRSYDSLSGHCSMIGSLSGKVINYDVCSKTCRVCESASKTGKLPPKHDCRKNLDGTAKSMEPAMVVNMVRKIKDKGGETSALLLQMMTPLQSQN